MAVHQSQQVAPAEVAAVELRSALEAGFREGTKRTARRRADRREVTWMARWLRVAREDSFARTIVSVVLHFVNSNSCIDATRFSGSIRGSDVCHTSET